MAAFKIRTHTDGWGTWFATVTFEPATSDPAVLKRGRERARRAIRREIVERGNQFTKDYRVSCTKVEDAEGWKDKDGAITMLTFRELNI